VRKKIGECLVHAGLITESDLEVALAEQTQTRERLGTVLVRLNFATEYQVATTLAWQLGFEFVNLIDHPPDPAAVVLIPKEIALKKTCVAIALDKNVLTVAMWDPLLFSVVQDLGFRTGCRVRQVVATREDILHAIMSSYPDTALTRVNSPRTPVHTAAHEDLDGEVTSSSRVSSGGARHRRPEDDVFEAAAAPVNPQVSETAPIIELVDQVIAGAIRNHASDVHIEPGEKQVIVRHRLDGILKEVMDVPPWVHEGVVARIKILAGMDIAERRLPQDGRIRTTAEDGNHVDFRVSTLRTIFGEKVVLRVLDNRKGVPSLDALGFSERALERLKFFMRHQHGMVLVVGPTGSGKTTTLSSALTAVRSERTNIITIEDPVEYQIPGVNQTQINDKIKLTFASALRSILRQDPDVVLVGEIRDLETARIALQAAQTGHLVLSTLHTDDAPS
jgi:type IV pilus assembly protein PilB